MVLNVPPCPSWLAIRLNIGAKSAPFLFGSNSVLGRQKGSLLREPRPYYFEGSRVKLPAGNHATLLQILVLKGLGFYAGVEGIEPPSFLLERKIIPLDHTPVFFDYYTEQSITTSQKNPRCEGNVYFAVFFQPVRPRGFSHLGYFEVLFLGFFFVRCMLTALFTEFLQFQLGTVLAF